MALNLAPLLIHSESVPAEARLALLVASKSSAENRVRALEAAARSIHHELDLSCRDAREVVGLYDGVAHCD